MTTFLPVISFATSLSFKCQAVDTVGIHKFDAHGVVNVDNLNKASGILSINVEKGQSIQTFEEVHIEGFIRHFGPGEVVLESFDQLVLESDEPYLKSLNLLIGYPEKLASKVYSIDNFVYRANCKLDN